VAAPRAISSRLASMPSVFSTPRGDRQLDELGRAAGGEIADRRGRQGRGRGHRPGHQMARAAERRVEQQRSRRRVETDDRRDAGDRGVGERLGNEYRPYRQAGEEVAAQPAAFIARRPAEDRDRPPDGAAGPAALGAVVLMPRYAGVSAKTVFQSFLMLITVQPWSAATSSDFSAPAV
jgi:hypothetical protein